MKQSQFCVVCRYRFLSTVEVLLILVYFFDTIVRETSSVCWLSNQSRVFDLCLSIFCVFCCDMFLSTAAVLLIIVYFFDPILLENPSVWCLRNQSRFFVHIFDYMEDLWLHVLNRTDQKWVGICQRRVWTIWLYCSEIDRRSEDCWMLGLIMLWNW